MLDNKRAGLGFITGGLIGTLGGLIGLGGAEFRLPVLVGYFRLATLEAVILNKAMSLIVVFTALIFRGKTIPYPDSFATSGYCFESSGRKSNRRMVWCWSSTKNVQGVAQPNGLNTID